MDMDLNQQALRTDVAGMPLEWIGYQDAVRLIALDQVSYSLGRPLYTVHGGINAISGLQSTIEVSGVTSHSVFTVASSFLISCFHATM